MIRRPPRSTRVRSSAASDVYKRQVVKHAVVVDHSRNATALHRADEQCEVLENLDFHVVRHVLLGVLLTGGADLHAQGLAGQRLERVETGALLDQELSLIHISEPTRPY